MLRETSGRSGTGRWTLGEVWDRPGNPRESLRRVGGPSGWTGTDWGTSGRSGRGWRTLGKVRDGSVVPQGGPEWV